MGFKYYHTTRFLVSLIRPFPVRLHVLNKERLQSYIETDKACIVAPTHASHLEPFFASLVIKRGVHWVTRIEFYKYKFFHWFLDRHLAFPVNRQQPGASTIKRGLAILEEGHCVGIFPEGGVARREKSVMRGADMKKGACLLSQRTGVPVVPIAMAGTHALNGVLRWLPFRWGYVVVAIGEPIYPPKQTGNRKADRAAQAAAMGKAYQALYQQILSNTKIKDSHDE